MISLPFDRHRLALSRLFAVLLLSAGFAACTTMKLILGGGTEQLRKIPPAPRGVHILVFALDGVGREQFAQALNGGETPNLRKIVGANGGSDGIYEHSYAVPDALSVLPSTTYDAWTSTFTGQPPAQTSIAGNEWFVRKTAKFYAPAPVSLPKPGQAKEVYSEDLLGKQIATPTIYEMIHAPSFVSLNMVYRGADIFTTLPPLSFLAFGADFAEGNLLVSDSLDAQRNAYARLDLDSVPLVVDAIEKHGVPTLQTVYFPGVDLTTHIAANPLPDQVKYLETVIDPCVGKIVDEYGKQGVLDRTYVVFISDHGHTPVLKDKEHAIGSRQDERARAVLLRDGFRVRKNRIDDTPNDFQAVLAYQGAMAYVYLADRSTCPDPGMKCDWNRPAQLTDVLAVTKSFYEANLNGNGFALKNALDLIFARQPVSVGSVTRPYEIFDGQRLVPIGEYLRKNPRPDLVDLEQRMNWLSAGPHGEAAGDVLLLSRSGLNRPIADRYYWSFPYSSWHGSPAMQDSNITFVISYPGSSGSELKAMVDKVAPHQVTQLDFVPLVLGLLKSEGVPLTIKGDQFRGNGPVRDAR